MVFVHFVVFKYISCHQSHFIRERASGLLFFSDRNESLLKFQLCNSVAADDAHAVTSMAPSLLYHSVCLLYCHIVMNIHVINFSLPSK